MSTPATLLILLAVPDSLSRCESLASEQRRGRGAVFVVGVILATTHSTRGQVWPVPFSSVLR